MTPSSRSRYVKTGGVVAFLILLFYILAPNDRVGVKDFVNGIAYVAYKEWHQMC